MAQVLRQLCRMSAGQSQHTSQVLSNKWAGLGALALALLLAALLPSWTGVTLVPFTVVNVKSLKVDWYNALLLTLVWTVYITLPVYVLAVVLLGLVVNLNYVFLAVYSPLYLVLWRSSPHTFNSLEYLYLKLFWDPPLLMWQRIVSLMGGRALKPFYTEIGQGVSMGSLPFSSDVATLHEQHKVRAVVNMCRESEGPVSEYRQRGITQLRLPTPDLCSPSVFDLIVGVRFITYQRKQLAAEETIFVHCKGGRGRAATMVLCYLVSQGWDAHEAIQHMHGKRSVVATAVLEYPAVQHFVALQKSGELDTLLRATEEALREWEKQNAHLDPHSVWRDSYTMDRDLQRKKDK